MPAERGCRVLDCSLCDEVPALLRSAFLEQPARDEGVSGCAMWYQAGGDIVRHLVGVFDDSAGEFGARGGSSG